MATRKKSSAKRQTKKERMAQIERQQAFKKEIFLWIVVAVHPFIYKQFWNRRSFGKRSKRFPFWCIWNGGIYFSACASGGQLFCCVQ